VIHSIIFGFGHRSRSGKDLACDTIIEERGKLYDIKHYSFGQELKREVVANALASGGMLNLFSDGLRGEGCGFLQENGNIIALPEWVQYDPEAPMDDPDCPLGKQRTLLQWWGTEYRRSVNQDYWLNKVALRISREKPEIALISDVRFPNEAYFCQKYGEVIKVHRPGMLKDASLSAVHISEAALATFGSWDDIIVNDSTLGVFRERVLFSFDMLLTTHPLQRPTLSSI
jgi:hypothetical protein